jgi:hypothetical protein
LEKKYRHHRDFSTAASPRLVFQNKVCLDKINDL